MSNKNGYEYKLFPSSNIGKEFAVGDIVWVLKGNKLFAKAKILEGACTDQASEYFGRFTN